MSTNESKFKGVYRCGKKWKSQIQINGIQHYIGVFDTQEEAAAEYNSVSKEAKKAKRKMIAFDDIQATNANEKKSRVQQQPDIDIKFELIEKLYLVTLSSEEASSLAIKLRFGQITRLLLLVQLSETNEPFNETDLQNLHNLIDEQIRSTKQIMGIST